MDLLFDSDFYLDSMFWLEEDEQLDVIAVDQLLKYMYFKCHYKISITMLYYYLIRNIQFQIFPPKIIIYLY